MIDNLEKKSEGVSVQQQQQLSIKILTNLSLKHILISAIIVSLLF